MRSTILFVAVAALFTLCGCSSDLLAPTQSAIALDKSFKLAVAGTAAFPMDRQIQVAPYVYEGNKICDDLAAKTNNFTKPLTVADFGAVAVQIAPDLVEVLSKTKPTTQPSTRSSP